MSRSKNETEIRIGSYNINSDRRVEWEHDPRYRLTSQGFSNFTFEKRWPLLRKLFEYQIQSIKQNKPNKGVDCICLQEVDDQALIVLNAFFKEHGYIVSHTKYCPDPGAFNLVFSYNPKKITLLNEEQLYYTQSGKATTQKERKRLTKEEKIERHLQTEFEKSAQLLWVKTAKHEKLLLINTHIGLTNEHKVAALHKLTEKLQDINDPIIISGDFNLFDMQQGSRQLQAMIDIMLESGFSWESEKLNSLGCQSTFLSFPYDIFHLVSEDSRRQLIEMQKSPSPKPTEYRALTFNILEKERINLNGLCLDAVFTRNLSATQVKTATMLPSGIFKPYKRSQSELQTEVKSHMQSNPKNPPLASDHHYLLIKI